VQALGGRRSQTHQAFFTPLRNRHPQARCLPRCMPATAESLTSFLWRETRCRSSRIGSYPIPRAKSWKDCRCRVVPASESLSEHEGPAWSTVHHMPPLQACLLEDLGRRNAGAGNAPSEPLIRGNKRQGHRSTETIPGNATVIRTPKARRLVVAGTSRRIQTPSFTASILTV